MKRKLISLWICLLAFSYVQAQMGKLFTADRELSNSKINEVYQDNDGIVWIATEIGLNRCDGVKFATYKHEHNNAHSLADNYVRVLLEDSKDRFFVGTLSGLQIYNSAADEFTTVPLFLEDSVLAPKSNISAILERKSGEVLIGTSGHGVFRLDTSGDSLRALQMDLQLPSFMIFCMYEDKDGNLWISTEDRGLFCIDAQNVKQGYFEEDSLCSNPVSSIYQDKEGDLFVGSLGSGFFQYNKEKNSFTPILYASYKNLPIKILYPFQSDKIYIGTDGCGLKVFDKRTREITESNFDILPLGLDPQKAKVHSILKDKSGNYWFGLYLKGVLLLPQTPNAFHYIGYKSASRNIIGSNCVSSIYKDSQDVLWVGTDNDGIYAIGPDRQLQNHFECTDDSHSVPLTVMAIFEDSNNTLWIGSYLNGMARMDRKTGRCEYQQLLKDDDQLSYAPRVYCFVEDRQKRLWIGTMGRGLFYIDLNTGKVTKCDAIEEGSNYQTSLNVLNNQWINCLCLSRDNKLYVGTYNGMSCLDLETMDFTSTYQTNSLLTGRVIYTIHEDFRGEIWVGTSDGLINFHPKTREIVNYTTKDGLSGSAAYAIEEDEMNNLWVSTNSGISCLSLRDITFLNYYANDGLFVNEFGREVSYKDKGGTLFFGGTNGIVCFNPWEVKNPVQKMDVRISAFYIHNKAVRKGMKSGGYDIVNTSVLKADTFHLSYKDNAFSIKFSAMEFQNPERVSYFYSMNNSEDFVPLASGIHSVSFSDLQPGEYHFRVKAHDYTFFSETREILIFIHPAWYASLVAKVFYAILALLVIVLVVWQIRHHYKVQQTILEYQHEEQLAEMKLQMYTNISHEIRTPMSLIIGPLQKLIALDKDANRSRTYAVIYRSAERILRLINQLMDIRKIEKGQMSLHFREIDIVGFLKELYATFEYQAKSKEIQFLFHSDWEQLKVWVDPANFDKIIMNVLSNAFKFTPEKGTIQMELRTGKDEKALEPLRNYFEIAITDNGIGVTKEEMEHIFERFYQVHNNHQNIMGTGVGLHLTHSLVELHHGTICVTENNQGEMGCRFLIRLPLGSTHLKPEEMEKEEIKMEPLMDEEVQLEPLLFEERSKMKSKSTKWVLVVEDDEEIRNYIREELSFDFHVLEASNGKEAFARILKKAPDLVISDVMMPEMDGLTLCRKIKQNVTINHLPVILLTAKSRDEDNLEGLNLGADAYLTKPFNIEILRKTVENLIKGRELLKNNFTGNQLQDNSVKKITIQSPDEKLMERIMNVINKNLDNSSLSVEMIALEVGISRVHLHRKMKELTNQSTRDFIRNVRLKQAATLLKEKHLNITEVATMTGFTNIAYFSTAFKELYGVPPTAYMGEHHKKTNE